MRVRTLPRDPGISGWNAILDAAEPARRLETDTFADWCVVGAGFAGLAAARRLGQLRPEDRIVVLDARRAGEGPAGRNSGFMIDLPHDLASDDYGGTPGADRAQTEDNRRAITFAAGMARDFGLDDEAFSLSGKINGAATAKGAQHNLNYAQHLKSLGETCELLSAGQMRRITGTDYYQSGLRTTGSAMLQPAKFIRGAFGRLRSNRIALFENSPVLSLARNGSWALHTPGGKVHATNVILAVNGHLESFGFMAGRLLHVHTYATMTQALTPDQVARLGGEARWGITPADPLGTTVRRISGTGGDRLVVRNRFTCDPSMRASAQQSAAIARDHDRSFRARFPMLEDVGMEYRWGGRLCLSRNSVQVIAELDRGLYAACCQNGLGTARGTLAGMLAAELALGIGSPALDRALNAAPPGQLPPKFLTWIGANLRIRAGEWRAGAEF